MSIPITCTICRASMKIADVFEQKKVRCTGCGTVMVVTPDQANPGNVTVSIPKLRDKKRGLTEAHKRIMLYTVFGAACLFFVYAFWWSVRGPDDKGAVEGTVTLDGAPLERGTIRFDALEGGIASTGTITRGRYSISANNGPGLGVNKVGFESLKATGQKKPNPQKPGEELDEMVNEVAKRFNEGDTQPRISIKLGSNKFDFDLSSK